MTARLLSWPLGLGISSMRVLEGPRNIGGNGQRTIGGTLQGIASPFGGWRFALTCTVAQGRKARSIRGWITAMHGGANATRVPIIDQHRMTLAEAGVTGSADGSWSTTTWDGTSWASDYPVGSIAAASAKGSTLVTLSALWTPGVGDWLSFFPFHFGAYQVTQVLDGGQVRVWPQLRAALTTDDHATLTASLVMRLEGEPVWSDVPGYQEQVELTFVEVPDDTVRAWFTD